MTNHIVDANKMVPPPHLLKKFSEQARVDSKKRGHSGYCKTFAKLCIDWALNSQPSAALAQPEPARQPTFAELLMPPPRTALAQPQPVAPTDEDVTELFYRHMGEGSEVGFENAIAEALARWGRPTPQPPAELAEMVKRLHEINSPTPQPVAVSERWPEFSDCNPFEAVWAFNPVLDHWKLTKINQSIHTHWLPHWALPVPTLTNNTREEN